MADIKIKKFKRGWVGGKTSLYVTSPYGVIRKMKWYKKARRHNGIDLGIPVGTPIYAPISGSLKCKFQKGRAGLYVTISSGGFLFMFMHLSKAALARGGSKPVKEGEIIGYSGGKVGDPNGGSSTGAHLHFEVRKGTGTSGASAINPVYWISDKLTGKVKQNSYNNESITIPLISSTETHNEYITITEEDIENDNNIDISDSVDESATEKETEIEKELKEGLAAGIWQITKLLIDGSVANLRIHDAATSVQAGSLISFFNKMCQQPLVEFMGDTYGDQYFFIARKPPFDRNGMLKTMVTQGLFAKSDDSENYSPSHNFSSPYEIQENDLISSNLSFNTQGIYSWYQFLPIYELGSPSELQYIIPAVLFPEYASIWGSRDLSIRSQYRSFLDPNIVDDLNENGKSSRGDLEVRTSIHDLKYIIECNAYNPFIRNGTITLMGNRKIKRGMFIRVNWADFSEIFYVESVSNSYNVTIGGTNRVTVITVSHGMVEDYMFGDRKVNSKVDAKNNDKSDVISYFNIINFGEYEKFKGKMTMDNWSNIISGWKVNKDVFLFFLRKLQLISNLSKTAVKKVTYE